MSRMGKVSAICYSTCLALFFFSSLQQQNLIKFKFDFSNGSLESDGEQQKETKEEEAEKTLPSGFFLISALGSTGSCAGLLGVSKCCIG